MERSVSGANPAIDLRKRLHPRVEFGPVFHQSGQHPDPQPFIGFHKAGSEDQVFHALSADKGGQPREIANGQTISERARNGKAEFRTGGSDAQIAAGRDHPAAAGTCARNGGYRGNAASLQPAQNPFHERLVANRVLGPFEIAEHRNVGARGEGFVPRPCYDQRLDCIVLAHGFASLAKLFIHLEGEGVPGFRPIDRDARDAAADFEEEVLSGVGDGHGVPMLARGADFPAAVLISLERFTKTPLCPLPRERGPQNSLAIIPAFRRPSGGERTG